MEERDANVGFDLTPPSAIRSDYYDSLAFTDGSFVANSNPWYSGCMEQVVLESEREARPSTSRATRRVAGVSRGCLVRIVADGEPLEAYDGESVAAALFAAGRRRLRRTDRYHEPRSLFCGMGVCFDCAVRINGRSNMLACQTPVADGMRVDTQDEDSTADVTH